MATESGPKTYSSWFSAAMNAETKTLSIVSFVTPAKVQRISYKNCKRQLSRALRGRGNFEDGLLLETTEKGVWYPIIHVNALGYWKQVPDKLLLNSDYLGSDFVLHQGIYEQIRRMESNEFPDLMENVDRYSPSNSSGASEDSLPTFIVLGFHGMDGCVRDVLEDTWKDWSFARYFYLNVPYKFGIGKMCFYRLISPKDVALFAYILLVQLHNVNDQTRPCLMDFIHRFRAQRAKGFLSVYQETCSASTSSESASDSRSSTSCA